MDFDFLDGPSYSSLGLMLREKEESVVLAKEVESYLPQIEKWAASGVPLERMDALLGVKMGTLRSLAKTCTELFEAWERGHMKARVELTNSAYKRALAGDTKLTTFLLSAVFGVSERTQVDMTGDITVTVEIGQSGEIGKKVTASEISRIIDVEEVRDVEEKNTEAWDESGPDSE
jgi:hypothetical protein